MQIAFYRNCYPQSLLIRSWTRRRGQRFADVPSHCAIVLPEMSTVVECVLGRGVCVRDIGDEDYAAIVIVQVPNPAIAEDWLFAQFGKGYDLAAYAADIFARAFPQMQVRTLDNNRFTCSRFISEALIRGGMDLPDQRMPYAPNDLLLTLREIEATQRCPPS